MRIGKPPNAGQRSRLFDATDARFNRLDEVKLLNTYLFTSVISVASGHTLPFTAGVVCYTAENCLRCIVVL